MLRWLIDRYAGASCLVILLGFALAAFFPFDPSPENEVGWLGGADGLRFRRGSVLGPSARSDDPARPCSIEIWAQPARGYSGVLIAFFDPGLPTRLAIEQMSESALRIRQVDASAIREMWVEQRFAPERPTLISVVADRAQTRVYVDAVLADASTQLHASMADCGSAFILGSGASSDSTWSGDLLGLALYERALDPSAVERHYDAWRTGQWRNLQSPAGPAPVALYVFAERSGNEVRDQTAQRRDLRIPDSLEVPMSSFLAWPHWVEVRMHDFDWTDIAVNIVGFTPFGFCLCAFLRTRLRMGRGGVGLAAIAGGLAASLAIEIVQSWLPTRTSSMTDVLTNTLGAAIGALLYLLLQRRSAPTG